MNNKNNIMKKTLLLLFSSTISCNTFAMESARDTSDLKLKSISSELTKNNSSNNIKSNIQKLFDEIAEEKKRETDPRYYNEISLNDFLDNCKSCSININRNEKLKILRSTVKKLYSEVDEWCYLNIENKEELSEDIYNLIDKYNNKMFEWWSTPSKNKTDKLKKNLRHEARIYLNKSKSIWSFIRGPKGLFSGTLVPKGVDNCHILEFGFNPTANHSVSGPLEDKVMRMLRATVTFKTEPFKEYKLQDKEKQIWSETTKYCVALRHEKDNNGNLIRLNPYEIKLSFHYGEFDKCKGKEYIIRDLDRFLKN